jgi:DNA-binding winged helix-turn-helix (wHTH) protein
MNSRISLLWTNRSIVIPTCSCIRTTSGDARRRDGYRLNRLEYRLFALLVEHAGEVMPQSILFMEIWEDGSEIREGKVDTCIRGLRKKLGVYADPYVKTVFGFGYCFWPTPGPSLAEYAKKPPADTGGQDAEDSSSWGIALRVPLVRWLVEMMPQCSRSREQSQMRPFPLQKAVMAVSRLVVNRARTQ